MEGLRNTRLVINFVTLALLLGFSWIFVYYYAVVPLMNEGGTLWNIFTGFEITSTKWWKATISLAFDVLVLIISVLGTWWTLGHFAVEAREAGKWRKYYKSEEARNDVWVEKWTLWQRVQHFWVLITFLICAVTGFMMDLRLYTNLGIARSDLIWVHVWSGLIMGIVIVIHFVQYLVEAILVKLSGGSIRERFPMMDIFSKRFILGIIKEFLYTVKPGVKPEPAGKYGFEQLFEYWGVYWGIAVLGIPGVLLTLYGPGVLGGILWVTHFKEAALAVSFILIVHMGYTHFRPKVFPMDPTFLYGKVPLKRIKEEHPLWAEKLMGKK